MRIIWIKALRMIENIFTVDVEDYFQVNNLSQVVKPSDWDSCESRVCANTYKVLRLLELAGVKATFFVLGWVAQRHPELIREIHRSGHEIASHGVSHKRVCQQSPDEFRKDIRKSKVILESIVNEPVYGYRAPTYSITRNTQWALDILSEEGFLYDSSIFPFRYEKKGLPGEKRYPHIVNRNGSVLWEFPVSTLNMAGLRLPFSGGGYFRLCPYVVIKQAVEAINRNGQPVISYIHPWEFDPEQPRYKLGALSAFRHYYGLRNTESKVKRLLSDFTFGSIWDYMQVNCGKKGTHPF